MSTNSQTPVGATTSAQAESFRGRSLSASLTVNDLQKSLVWYRDVVGFVVADKYEHEGKLVGVSLQAGEVRLLIGQDDGAKGWDRTKGEALSLLITTDQNVDELANRIKKLGGTLEMEPADMPWGARMFRLRDPNGFKFAISTPLAT